jgi:hypothetical protein
MILKILRCRVPHLNTLMIDDRIWKVEHLLNESMSLHLLPKWKYHDLNSFIDSNSNGDDEEEQEQEEGGTENGDGGIDNDGDGDDVLSLQ